MAYKSTLKNNNDKTKKRKKVIYLDNELWVAEAGNGYRLYYTTKDPDVPYGQVKIGDLAEEPPRDVRGKLVSYGLQKEKQKWPLKKEKVQKWIEEAYGFKFSEKNSKHAPKVIGAAAPETSDTEEEEEEEEAPPRKRRKREDDEDEEDSPRRNSLLLEIKDTLEHHTILLQQLTTEQRQISTL